MGQCCSAASTASWTRSSAVAKSPVTCISAVASRPACSRTTLASSSCEVSGGLGGVVPPGTSGASATDHSSGRISTIGQPGQVLTMRRASSRSATSISVYPLTTSLPSTNGPSVITGSPRSSRTVVAVSGGRSLLPPRILSPLAAIHSITPWYARSRSAGPMASRSRSNSSVPTNSSTYFIVRVLPWLAEQLGHPPCHLLRRHVFHVRGDGPPVPERVGDVPVAVTVELVLRGALHRRAEFGSARDDRVDVIDVNEQVRGKPGQATRRWCLGSALRVLVLDDHHGVTDLDLGMEDGPAWPGEAHALGRAEGGRVELESLPGAPDGQAGCDAAIRIRDRVGPCRCCHATLLHGEVLLVSPLCLCHLPDDRRTPRSDTLAPCSRPGAGAAAVRPSMVAETCTRRHPDHVVPCLRTCGLWLERMPLGAALLVLVRGASLRVPGCSSGWRRQPA